MTSKFIQRVLPFLFRLRNWFETFLELSALYKIFKRDWNKIEPLSALSLGSFKATCSFSYRRLTYTIRQPIGLVGIWSTWTYTRQSDIPSISYISRSGIVRTATEELAGWYNSGDCWRLGILFLLYIYIDKAAWLWSNILSQLS